MLKAKELRDQTREELVALEIDKRKELFSLKTKLAREKKNENPAVTRHLRHDIAKIKTVLREKELANLEGS